MFYWNIDFIDYLCNILIIDVQNEKTQQSLFAGIENFDAKNLKHAETQEKNLLPDKDGKLINDMYIKMSFYQLTSFNNTPPWFYF